MDQRNLIIAIVLSILVFLVWSVFFSPQPPPPKQTQTQEEPASRETATDKQPYIKEKDSAATQTVPMVEKPVKQPAQVARELQIETSRYIVKLSARGAAFQSYVLKDYRETNDVDSPNKEMVSTNAHKGTIQLSFDSKIRPDLTQAIFSVDAVSDRIQVADKSHELSFTWVSDDGIVVEKKYIFSPDTYLIGLEVTIKNGSSAVFSDQLVLSLNKVFSEKGTIIGFQGPSTLIGERLEQIDLDDIEDKNVYRGKLKWIAVQDRYFLSSIIPQKAVDARMRLFLKDDDFLQAQYLPPESVVQPGIQQTLGLQLYLGPKSTKTLSKYDNSLEKLIEFGWFTFLAKPCLWFMNFLHDNFIPNYGVAIIILTLVTKILLFPLGQKSYKSMSEMKKIQPLIKELREKYKNDRKKMNEETMALYRTYKINPLGGCLPMVVQIPVFFALYRMLYGAIELRHAPFFLWINDLSAPDRLFRFNFTIPLMEPPYGIPVLTIIMGASMILQQKMSPPMGDPTQAKMMMLMPVVFTFIFINFSSGLVLYWLINNLFSIIQQYYTTKKLA